MSDVEIGVAVGFAPDPATEPQPDVDFTVRERTLSRTQIEAITDMAALAGYQERYAETCIIIETNLQFPGLPGEADPLWYRRARMALIIHRMALSQIGKRLKHLRQEESKAARAAYEARIAAEKVE